MNTNRCGHRAIRASESPRATYQRVVPVRQIRVRDLLAFGGFHCLDEAEIEQFDKVGNASLLRQKNVRRFDVAMNQPHAVGLAQRAAKLQQDVDHAALPAAPPNE